MALLATTERTGDGATSLVTISWSYQNPDHVKAYVDGIETAFTFTNPSAIDLATVPALGAKILVRRETPLNVAFADFTDGSPLTEADLDGLTLSMLNVAQEVSDRLQLSVEADVTGNLDASGRRIVNVASPVDDDDAANKGYVTARLTAATTGVVFRDRSAEAAQAALDGLSDGEVFWMAGESYQKQSTAMTYQTATEDLAKDGIVPFGPQITLTHFGGVDGTDVITSLQRATNYHMYGSPGRGAADQRLVLNVGDVTASGTWHIGYGEVGFRSARIEGLGDAYDGNAYVHNGTVITSTVADAPSVAISGIRRTEIKDIAFVGPGKDTIETLILPGGTYSRTKELLRGANWDAALTADGISAGGQFNTSHLLGVDPYAGPEPAQGYPTYANPSYLGGDPFETNVSSDLRIWGCTFIGDAGHVFIQPGDNNTNGDFVDVTNCVFSNGKHAISVGNNQARSLRADNVNFKNVHTAFATVVHGQQQGQISSTVTNGHCAGFLAQIFDLGEGAISKGLHLQSWRGESMGRLGRASGGSFNPDHVFTAESCVFNFQNFEDQSVVGNLIAGDFFDSMFIRSSDFSVHRVAAMTKGDIQLDSNFVFTESPVTQAFEAAALNTLSGGFVLDPNINRPFVSRMRVWDVSNPGTVAGVGTTDASFNMTGRNHRLPFAVTAGRCPSIGGFANKRMFVGNVAAGKTTSVTPTGKLITLTNDNLTSIDRAYKEGYVNGGVWVDRSTGTVAFVRSFDLGTKATTLELQNNFYFDDVSGDFEILDAAVDMDEDGNVFDPDAASWSTMAGTVFCPDYLLIGDVTAGSNVITNVRTPTGTVPADWGLIVGERLAVECYHDDLILGSTGMEITAIDTGARTITLTGNFRNTREGLALPFWHVIAPANV